MEQVFSSTMGATLACSRPQKSVIRAWSGVIGRDKRTRPGLGGMKYKPSGRDTSGSVRRIGRSRSSRPLEMARPSPAHIRLDGNFDHSSGNEASCALFLTPNIRLRSVECPELIRLFRFSNTQHLVAQQIIPPKRGAGNNDHQN